MSANENWDDWINKFVEKIVQILGSEGAQSGGRIIQSQIPENDLIHHLTVTNMISGNQTYMNIVKKPIRRCPKSNSIGKMYEASLLACKRNG